ncbi:MAG: DNA repair protein RecN, partial [Gammaproteobacteria bacterium]|nr:DNA repair protein RecN [Gammaproteobacteria bacterium]
KRGEQLHLLDHYADSGVLLTKMSAAFRHWEQLIQQQQSQLQSESERNDRIALLNFQLDELDRLALQEGELAQLEREHSQLTNGEKLIELGQQTYQLLDGEDEQFSAIQQLYRATSHLESLESLDPTTQPLRERLVEITVLATDIASELQESVSNYTLDPARLEWLNERLTLLSDLARKHHCTPETLFQHHQQLQQQRDQLRQQTTALEQLENKISQAEQQCHQFAEQLHQRRADAIPLLQQAVNREIHQLGMAQSHFHIALSPLANQAFRLQGHDEVQFEVQTNTGSPLAPLTKVASGGELSRISLAIQLAAAHRGQTPTLIFDEVDSGIGGGTAEQVGKKLRQLGESAQILCVTHLPQVAAQGHHHLKIEKAADHNGEHTTSQITLLDEAGRTFEVARMLGGMEITQQTHAHASEMVSHSSPTE